MRQRGLSGSAEGANPPFCFQKGFDIEGLGKKQVEQLVDQKLLFSFADLFLLTQEQLMPLDRMAEKSAHNLISAIDRARQISFHQFIFALGIHHTGEHAARLLARTFDTLADLMAASKEDLEAIHGLGSSQLRPLPDFLPVLKTGRWSHG